MTTDFNPKAFFDAAIASGRLAHAYVLQGHNTAELYEMALYVASVLNCDGEDKPCGACTNCRWIKQNAHPAVLTVSRLTFITTDMGEDLTQEQTAKLLKSSQAKLIKTGQIQRLIQQLGLSSPFKRVVIFTDLEELPASAVQEGMAAPPAEWTSLPGNEEKRLALKPLHRGIFNANSVNRFLKTLEEPPPNTLIFYLTDDTQNLLETVVSRCQVVPFPKNEATAPLPPYAAEDAEFLGRLLSDLSRSPDFYPSVDQFLAYFVAGQGLSESQALTLLQAYLQRTDFGQDFATYRHRQRLLDEASQRLAAKTNTTQTLNHLFWQWSVVPV